MTAWGYGDLEPFCFSNPSFSFVLVGLLLFKLNVPAISPPRQGAQSNEQPHLIDLTKTPKYFLFTSTLFDICQELCYLSNNYLRYDLRHKSTNCGIISTPQLFFGRIWGICVKKSGGRPPVEPAHRIRAMAWFQAVSLASGLDAAHLEVLFGSTKDAVRPYTLGARPGLWDKYRDGVICPKIKQDSKGRPSIVERVEERFPGTAKWMTLPLWEVLGDAQMSLDDLKRVYCSLAPFVRRLIVLDTPSDPIFFWRRPMPVGRLCKYLARARGLDAATAMLALMKEAEATRNQEMHQELLLRWAPFAAWLHKQPVLSKVSGKINRLIEDRYVSFEYVEKDGEYFSFEREDVRSVMVGNPLRR